MDSISPFLACVMDNCLEKGLLPTEMGAKYNWFGLMCLGIGTLIDGIYTIKRLVYEDKVCFLNELILQTQQNFPDDELFLKCRNLEGKYGTNSPESNELAYKLSTLIGNTVHAHTLENGVKISPALFRWFGDIYTAEYPATPDGRRKGERLSYGAAPCEFVKGMSPTSMLLSMGHLNMELFPDGCPVTMSFAKHALESKNGRMAVKGLIETYFANGGFHMQFNVQSAEELKVAMENPVGHEQLLIRGSGHSNYFINLDRHLQETLVERTEQGR